MTAITTEKIKFDVKDMALASHGKRRIEWAERDMPVLRLVRERFSKEKPFKGMKMSACLHVTTETANLARTLQAGGADLCLCASNPLSTQDDVAASLVKDFGIPVFAIKGESREIYYRHLTSALEHQPVVTLDDGADLVSEIHSSHKNLVPHVLASMEETTTGVIRLRAMEKSGALKIPVLAVNDAQTKHLFDNRYGTGQSTLDGIIRATNILLAGRVVVTGGYGWCGKGFAMRAKGMGSQVIVTEVDPIRALEAAMDGFEVMSMEKAAELGDLFCTLTGDIHVLRREHFLKMKDGAILCNSGHFNVEIDIPALEKLAKKVTRNVRDYVDEFVLSDGRRIFLIAEGRLVNLSTAEGHPASVMDMSFSVQALACEYAVKHAKELTSKVYDIPKVIDEWVAKLKLQTMGIGIDELTQEQKKYLVSWQEGT